MPLICSQSRPDPAPPSCEVHPLASFGIAWNFALRSKSQYYLHPVLLIEIWSKNTDTAESALSASVTVAVSTLFLGGLPRQAVSFFLLISNLNPTYLHWVGGWVRSRLLQPPPSLVPVSFTPLPPEPLGYWGARLLVPHPGVSRLWGYLRAVPGIVRWIPVLPAPGAQAAGGKSDCPSEEATKPKRGPRGV